MDKKNLERLLPLELSNFNSFEEYKNYLLNARINCDNRGYHRVSHEPKSNDSLMICYDCDLWFDKEFAVSCGIEYKVEEI